MRHGIVKCQFCDITLNLCSCDICRYVGPYEVTHDLCSKCKTANKDMLECMQYFYERNKIMTDAYKKYDYETAHKIVMQEIDLMNKKFEEVKNRKVLDRKDIHCTFYKKDCMDRLCSADNSSDKKDCRFAEMKNA